MTTERAPGRRWEAVAAGAVLFVPAVLVNPVVSSVFSERFLNPKAWTGSGLAWLAMLGVMAARRWNGEARVRIGDGIWFLTVMAAAVSLANCGHALTGAQELSRLASLAALFLLLRTAGDPWRLLPLLLAAGAANALLAFGQAAGIGPEWGVREGRHAIYGTFGNPSFLGEYLAPLVILAAAWAVAGDGRARWVGGGALAAALLGGVLLTVSRAAWLGLAAGGAVFASVALPVLRRPGAVARSAAILALPAAVTLVLWKPLWVRIASSAPARDPGVVTRVFMWRVAASQFADHPVLGVGPGGYGLGYLDHAARLQRPGAAGPAYAGITREAHSDPLQLLAERGALGAAAWLAAFVWIMLPAARVVPATAGESRLRAAAALGALAAILVESLFGFPMRVFPVAGVFLWALAVLPRRDPGAGIPMRTAAVPVAGLALVCLWLDGRTMVADGELAAGRGSAGGETALRRGLALLPAHGELNFRLGREMLRQDRFAEAASGFKAALPGFPDPDAFFNLGLTAKREGRYPEAVDWFQEGLRRYPYYRPEAYADLAETLLAAGRPAEARAAALRALAINPALSRARGVLNQL